MPNYWLGIMAVALAATLAIWIALVFRADRYQSRQPQEPVPKREVIGGIFAARKGGRQVMPDPEEPIVHDDWEVPEVAPGVPEQTARTPEQAASFPEQGANVPGQASPETTRQAAQPTVPEQRTEPVPGQAPARGDGR
ncbi:MAG TPA: hypothetical protein VMU94_06520 [Streptosporangiaceae bacterium]|nr:hypothetical protein [Streptosporangiaceae bacterium]